jgi:Mor family transcriptional regulator
MAMVDGYDRLTLSQIGAELGDEMVRMLSSGFGGTRLYIPLQPEETSPVVLVLGDEAAKRLGRRFGGEAVQIPLHKSRAQRRRDRDAILQLREQGHSVSSIAREIGCSERHVYHVLASHTSP